MIKGQEGTQRPDTLGAPSGYPMVNLQGPSTPSSSQAWQLRLGVPSQVSILDPLTPVPFLLLPPASQIPGKPGRRDEDCKGTFRKIRAERPDSWHMGQMWLQKAYVIVYCSQDQNQRNNSLETPSWLGQSLGRLSGQLRSGWEGTQWLLQV